STAPLQTVLLPPSVVLAAHQLAMPYSFARIRKTVISYHVLIRVLGNDKRLSGELPEKRGDSKNINCIKNTRTICHGMNAQNTFGMKPFVYGSWLSGRIISEKMQIYSSLHLLYNSAQLWSQRMLNISRCSPYPTLTPTRYMQWLIPDKIIVYR